MYSGRSYQQDLAKNRKAEQTIIHGTTKQYKKEKKRNAMQCNENAINQGEWYRTIVIRTNHNHFNQGVPAVSNLWPS